MKTKKLMIFLVLTGVCLSMFISNVVSPEVNEDREQRYAEILVSNYPQNNSLTHPTNYNRFGSPASTSNENSNINCPCVDIFNVSEENLKNIVQTLQDFDTRYVFSENCSLSAEWIYSKFCEYDLWAEYDCFEYENHTLKNVVGTLNGTSDNIYIISAHYDSINSKDEVKSTDNPNASAPGADDDASGIASVLESARIMSQYRFNATIKFVAFSCEELGLIGSRYYAESMKNNDEKIIGDIQLDMIGYGNDSIDIVTNPESVWIAEIMENVSIDYEGGLNVNKVINSDLKYSDHASFWNNGYSAVCLIENATPGETNPYFHSKNDTIEKLNFTLIKKTTQLCIATLVVLANISFPENVNKYALLIGIEDYPGSGNDLDYTVDDVYDMCDVLINNCYFDPANIRVLTDANATKTNIQNNITWLASNAKPDDIVIFLFSGHGGHDYVLVYGNTISDNELDLWFSDINSTNVVIIIDSCYAASMIEKSKMGYMDEAKNFSSMHGVKNEKTKKVGGFAKGLGQSGRIVLASCTENQYSWEYDELSNGVFTYYLIEGLKSASADNNTNGWVSVEEAFYYAKPKTYQFNNSENPVGGQDPQIYDGIEGELDISSLTPTGDLIVDGIKTYHDLLPINRNLIVTSDGNLTLNNVTLLMNPSFNGEYHIEVQSGGQLYIYNSNITSANEYSYLFWVRNNSKFEMMDSELSKCGYEWGENGGKAGLFIQSNNIKIDGCLISNNYWGIILNSSSDNIVTNCLICNNSEGGIHLFWSSCDIVNSTICWNLHHDIGLNSNSNLDILNTTFNKTKVYVGANSTLNVSWYLHINVLWNNSIPAEYANVIVIDNLTNEIFNGSTDGNGKIKNIIVQEYIKNQTSTTYFTPYTITISKNGYYGSETVEMDQSKEIAIYLEDTTSPNANAGNDQEVDVNTTIYFDASNSTDNSGVIGNYTWRFVDSDGEVTLYGVSPNYTFYNSGVFVVTLNVTDGSGKWDTDTINIRVEDRTPPNADAGEDREVYHGIAMMFDGANSTDNVGVVNYTWTFFDNNDVVLYGINPEYVFLTLGMHLVTLTVKDEADNRDTDTVNIIVKDVTKPDIKIVSPEPVVHSRDCTVKCVVTDNVKVERVEVSLNNRSWSSCVKENIDEYTATLILRDGKNTIYIRATDSSGNVNTTSITVFVETPEDVFPVFTSDTIMLLIAVVFCIVVTIILEHKPKRRKGL